jgi:hypothetical protein
MSKEYQRLDGLIPPHPVTVMPDLFPTVMPDRPLRHARPDRASLKKNKYFGCKSVLF